MLFSHTLISHVHTPFGLQVGARARGALDRVKEEAERQEAEVSLMGAPVL